MIWSFTLVQTSSDVAGHCTDRFRRLDDVKQLFRVFFVLWLIWTCYILTSHGFDVVYKFLTLMYRCMTLWKMFYFYFVWFIDFYLMFVFMCFYVFVFLCVCVSVWMAALFYSPVDFTDASDMHHSNACLMHRWINRWIKQRSLCVLVFLCVCVGMFLCIHWWI